MFVAAIVGFGSMGLADAQVQGGATPALPTGPPYACAALTEWAGASFWMPPGDPRLEDIHAGGPAPSPPLDNLVGAVRYWDEHPDWMEFLDPSSPSYDDKMVERGLYLDRWRQWIPDGARVLDLGGGVGRFTAWLLEHDAEVEIVDPDLRSLWRALQAGVNAGRGRLDLHWTTGERLPELRPVDLALAVEVLCYVEEPDAVAAGLARLLRPGGTLLCSVEARWGWAMAADVHQNTVDAFLGDGIVHAEGDRWVRTFTEESLRALLEGAGLEVVDLHPSHYAFSGPFEACSEPLGLEDALALEARLRAHPVSRPLNRAWMAVARKPA